MNKNKLIFSPFFQDLGIIINYLDVGARGDISLPWSLFANKALKVIGFEPDPIEAKRLADTYEGRVYYPHALWGSVDERPFYLNEWESTSSMYPSNYIPNQVYLDRHWLGRKAKATLDVKCVDLDGVLAAEDEPDFIKLDTQGSEYEILRGARKILEKGNPLVLCETWCAEVYEGAPLTHEVMGLMYELGYTLFDINIAASWQHKSQTISKVLSKSRTIGFDLLFIKKSDKLVFENEIELIKFAALCELYGFRDYAISQLEISSFNNQPLVKKALAAIVENSQYEASMVSRLTAKFGRLLGVNRMQWPTLHD